MLRKFLSIYYLFFYNYANKFEKRNNVTTTKLISKFSVVSKNMNLKY